jgi:hypothetical protein
MRFRLMDAIGRFTDPPLTLPFADIDRRVHDLVLQIQPEIAADAEPSDRSRTLLTIRIKALGGKVVQLALPRAATIGDAQHCIAAKLLLDAHSISLAVRGKCSPIDSRSTVCTPVIRKLEFWMLLSNTLLNDHFLFHQLFATRCPAAVSGLEQKAPSAH